MPEIFEIKIKTFFYAIRTWQKSVFVAMISTTICAFKLGVNYKSLISNTKSVSNFLIRRKNQTASLTFAFEI